MGVEQVRDCCGAPHAGPEGLRKPRCSPHGASFLGLKKKPGLLRGRAYSFA